MRKTYCGLALVAIVGVLVMLYAQADVELDSLIDMDEESASVATFAGGCFWCTESDFEKLPGVIKVISGYTGGEKESPTYREVASGATQHLESVKVFYDENRISYDELLSAFWRMVDPTDQGGQFYDRGKQYSTAIFYHNEQQQRAAEESLRTLDSGGRYDAPIVTPIRQAGAFYAAEHYHQDYYKTNPLRYRLYRWKSGRDSYLSKVWGEEKVSRR